jgi:hypothetical protein
VSARPILVTGAHRSGTTWVGKMLAAAPGVGYVHEPFSPATEPGISSAPFERYFTVVTAANEARYLPGLERTLRFDYALGAELRALRTPAQALRAARDRRAFAAARREGARPLVKDPIALLSAEWLAARFGMDVVLVVRHPAGFAGSVKRLRWTHDFGGFLADGALPAELARFEPEIRDFAERPRGPVEQAALLWRILYAAVDAYRSRHPAWLVVRHEDLSREPLAGFERLYGALGLEWTPQARAEVERSSSVANPPEARSKHDVRVASAENVDRWRARLTPPELELVRERTRDVWPRFYADDEW